MAPTPLTLAETASVFGEMLTFRALLARAKSPAERKAMLVSKVEDDLARAAKQFRETFKPSRTPPASSFAYPKTERLLSALVCNSPRRCILTSSTSTLDVQANVNDPAMSEAIVSFSAISGRSW